MRQDCFIMYTCYNRGANYGFKISLQNFNYLLTLRIIYLIQKT